jgi:penicillin-binding protein 1A
MHNHHPEHKGLYTGFLMRFFVRLLPYALGLLATLMLGAFGSGYAAYYYLRPALPSVEEMRDIRLQIPLRIYTRDGKLMGQVGEKKRTPVDYENIPEVVVQAFLAAEDDRFFEHPGFDYQGIMRAAFKLVTTGSRAQGGSTITQQLAREYFLSLDRTFIRKAKELILAIQIESEFTKPEILALYLNKIFLGQRAYGVAAAAEVYFGKTLDKLTIAEAATIAGLPAAPSRLNPVSNPDQSTDRRSYVLGRMRELKFISEEEYKTAMNTPMVSRLHGPQVDLDAPYAAELARAEMVSRFGTSAYTEGYRIITTIDSELQVAANSALRQTLVNYDRRHGYRGPVEQVAVEEIIQAYANRDTDPVDEAPETDKDTVAGFALQDFLNDYDDFENLGIAVVTELNTEADGARMYLRDTGYVELSWEQIRWRRYINDDVVDVEPESVADMLAVGDVVYLLTTADGYRLGQLPEAQGAYVAFSAKDGAASALVGGFDYAASSFNRATQTRRQPGSAFKPFIYSAALEKGFTAATIVNDAPIVLNSLGQEEAWRPENYSKEFYGPSRLREGLVKSMNLVSIRVLREIGIRHTLNHLEPLGLPPDALPRDLSLALGTGGLSPWQLGEAYASLASGGYAIEGYFVDRILDAEGNVVYAAEPINVCEPCEDRWYDGREQAAKPEPPKFAKTEPAAADERDADDDNTEDTAERILIDPEVPLYADAAEMIEAAADWRPDSTETPAFWENRNQAKRVLSAQNAYIVYDMMRDVIKRGTGRRARDLGRDDLAGKTGTSNNRRDAWFSGFNSELVGIAWVGFDDDSRSLGAGEAGGATALPMWKDFMAVALANKPEAPLAQPDGIVSVRISSETGMLADYRSDDAMFEIFRAGEEPGSSSGEFEFGESDVFVEDGSDGSIF